MLVLKIIHAETEMKFVSVLQTKYCIQIHVVLICLFSAQLGSSSDLVLRPFTVCIMHSFSFLFVDPCYCELLFC